MALSSPVNAGLWRNRVLQAVEEMKQDLQTAFSLAVAETARRTILRTPVGDPSMWASGGAYALANGYKEGTLRANWQIQAMSPSTVFYNIQDKSGEKTIGKAVAQALVPSNVYYLTNNTPYAARIEYDAYSSQASAGMLRITLSEWQDVLNVAANTVRVGGSKKLSGSSVTVV